MEINYKGSHRDIKVLPKLMPDDTKQVHMRFTDTQTPRHDPDLNTLHKTPHGSVKNTQTHSLMHSPAYTQLALVLCFVLHMVCLWEVICCFSTYTHTPHWLKKSTPSSINLSQACLLSLPGCCLGIDTTFPFSASSSILF